MTNVLTLQKVDYENAEQVNKLFSILQEYAKDPMGGGEAISEETINVLPSELAKRPYMHSFIVLENDDVLAFANCIESFSTFTGQGVLNIHDFAVTKALRGKGLSQFLLKGIEDFARTISCTKLTLEVLEGNRFAIRAYEKAGFSAYQLDPQMGNAMFWQKKLD